MYGSNFLIKIVKMNTKTEREFYKVEFNELCEKDIFRIVTFKSMETLNEL
jgi:hypothetical protein